MPATSLYRPYFSVGGASPHRCSDAPLRRPQDSNVRTSTSHPPPQQPVYRHVHLRFVNVSTSNHEMLLRQTFGLRSISAAYPLFVGLWSVIAVLGMATSNRKVHGVLAIAWPVVTLTYVSQAVFRLWGDRGASLAD